MPTHNLQDEPESTIGSKPMHEEEHPAREGRAEGGETPPFGVSRMRREEGEETEIGGEIRDHDYPEDVTIAPDIRGVGEEQ